MTKKFVFEIILCERVPLPPPFHPAAPPPQNVRESTYCLCARRVCVCVIHLHTRVPRDMTGSLCNLLQCDARLRAQHSLAHTHTCDVF